MGDHAIGHAMARSGPASVPAPASDLALLWGRRAEQLMVARPATTVYCTQPRDAAVRDLDGFVAHHYAQHVEDLAVGPDLTAAVGSAYGVQDPGRFL
jgi:hypothetical protein